jgi:hypothetical protein
MLELLALVLCLVAPQDPGQLVEKETWPSGGPKVERHVIDMDGHKVLDGDFKSWFENGQIEAEGRYAKGQLTGAWITHWPNGAVASRGRYVHDKRDGKWTFFHDDRSEDLANSGDYHFDMSKYADGATSCEGYLRDGKRHGPWTFYWSDHAVQFEGNFRNGLREGEWVFFGLDGAPTQLVLSGDYAGGVRATPFDAAKMAQLREQARSRGLLKPISRSAVPEWFYGEPAAAKALPAGAGASTQYRSAIARGLATLDLTSPKDAKAAREWIAELKKLANGHTFGALPDEIPAGTDVTSYAEICRAWSAVLAVAGADECFWEFDLRSPCATGKKIRCPGPCARLAAPTVREGERRETGFLIRSNPTFATRFDPAKSSKQRGGKETDQAIASALAWLAAHQSPDGSWDSDGFKSNCGHIAANSTCDGAGLPQYDVGVTGLALLALMGNGSTLRSGEYARNVRLGAGWLMDQQNPESGLVQTHTGTLFFYGDCISTLALAEAYGGFENPDLRQCVERGVHYLLRAQNPNSAWRYSGVPPDGKSDTSVTYWAFMALWTAREMRIDVDDAAFIGAMNWIDAMTDPQTGRTGYFDVGSPSARQTHNNDQFPLDKAEGLTGVGLQLRYFAGRRPASDPMIVKGLNLMASEPPIWSPESLSIDFYSWFQETNAYTLLGGNNSKQRDAWNKALKSALLGSQQTSDDLKGSWDAKADTWGFAGGRVFTTALGAMCLESSGRYDATAVPDKKK